MSSNESETIKIGRKDLLWNYAATGMRILSGVVVLPLALRMLPTQEMGLWTIFTSLTLITNMFDFGFSGSFTRNITYIFSGSKELKSTGYTAVETTDVDYSLLKSVIVAMKRYYGVVSLLFLLLFLIGSPFYLPAVLAQYEGDGQSVWIAWLLFGGILSYELYTFYYIALLMGKGLVKRNMQIIVVAQSIRIVVTGILLWFNVGIISLVIGLLTADVANRMLSHYAFYSKEMKNKLAVSPSTPVREMLKTMAPVSIKVGLVAFGSFLLWHSVTLIASFFLPLSDVAQYGLSRQMMMLISSLSYAWFSTFYPKLSQYRVQEKIGDIKRLYIKSKLNMLLVFIVTGSGLLLFGNEILILIRSKTYLLTDGYLALMLLCALIDANQNIAISTLLTKNEVPFFKSTLITGIASVVLLMITLKFTSWGVLALILVPAISLGVYHNWKWPWVVQKELRLTPKDYYIVLKNTLVQEFGRKQ